MVCACVGLERIKDMVSLRPARLGRTMMQGRKVHVGAICLELIEFDKDGDLTKQPRGNEFGREIYSTYLVTHTCTHTSSHRVERPMVAIF